MKRLYRRLRLWLELQQLKRERNRLWLSFAGMDVGNLDDVLHKLDNQIYHLEERLAKLRRVAKREKQR